MKEIIKLAKEKGFESELKYLLNSNYKDLSEFDYFWMCELQKWLMQNHSIFVYAHPYHDYAYNNFDLSLFEFRVIKGVECVKEISDKMYKISDEALEKGLFEALKLID